MGALHGYNKHRGGRDFIRGGDGQVVQIVRHEHPKQDDPNEVQDEDSVEGKLDCAGRSPSRVCSVLSSLSCLNISGDSRTFFDQFVNMSTMFSLLAWISILVTHLAFLRARKAQSVPDKALAFKAPLGAVGSAVALAFCVLIIVIRSFDIVDPGASIRRFDYIAFLTSYLAIPLYVCLIVGYKGFTRCASVSPSDVDLGVVKDETDGSEDVIVQCAQDVSCTRIHQGEKPSRRSWPRARFQG